MATTKKKTTKKATTKKTPTNFEPDKVTFGVALLAGVTIVVFSLLLVMNFYQ